jgi:site-specific recombinase XerD
MYLQKALGHSTLQMTRRYTELNDDDLKQMHKKTSILSRPDCWHQRSLRWRFLISLLPP